MKSFIDDFKKCFEKVTESSDDVIVIQSQIIPIASYYKISGKKILEEIYNFIIDLSKYKTVMLPAFSDDIIKFKKFDLMLSKCNTGSLPNYCIEKKEFKRNLSPLHSFIAYGPRANEIVNLKQDTTWGKGSVFEWIEKNNSRWIALNLEWRSGCALHHRAEELTRVPYRFFKKYHGSLYLNKNYVSEITETKYSYSLDVIPNFDYSIWPNFFKKNDTLYYKVNNGIKMRSALAKIIVQRSMEFYLNDPYLSIINKENVQRWVESKK